MRSSYSFGRRESVKFDGIGILDVDRDVYHEREYHVWYDMLARCHPPNWSRPKLASYAGCTVGDSFRLYSDFKAWLDARWEQGRQLDKDIKLRMNRVYSAETCLVVSQRVNKAFQLKPRDGLLPFGVKVRPHGKFAATGFGLDGTLHAKHFSDLMSAHRYWQTSKAQLLLHLAQFESDEAKAYIIRRADYLLDDATNRRYTMEVL